MFKTKGDFWPQVLPMDIGTVGATNEETGTLVLSQVQKLKEGSELSGTQKASKGPLPISSNIPSPAGCQSLLPGSSRLSKNRRPCLSLRHSERAQLSPELPPSISLCLGALCLRSPFGSVSQSWPPPPFLPGQAVPSLSAGAGRLREGNRLGCHGHVEAEAAGRGSCSRPEGGQSQAALAASNLEPQRPETGGTGTQDSAGGER